MGGFLSGMSRRLGDWTLDVFLTIASFPCGADPRKLQAVGAARAWRLQWQYLPSKLLAPTQLQSIETGSTVFAPDEFACAYHSRLRSVCDLTNIGGLSLTNMILRRMTLDSLYSFEWSHSQLHLWR